VKAISAAAALLACSTAPPRASRPLAGTATVIAPVRLAVAAGSELSVVEVSPAGTKVLRSAKVGAHVDTLAWEGDDPIALLQRASGSCDMPEEFYKDHAAYEAAQRECTSDAALEGTVGRLTEHGFVPYPRLPESTWSSIAAQPKDFDPCRTQCWSLDVRATEVWLGHCKWTFSADGADHCDTWAYVRLDRPGPAQQAYPRATSGFELPTVAASPRVTLTFEPVTPPPRYDGDEPEAKLQLNCSLDGAPAVVYPEPKDLDAGMSSEVTWLATSPPIFAASHNHDGFAMTSELVVFDRCKRTRYDKLVAGPGGLVALVGDQIEIRRNGSLVGSTSSGEHVVFAPR
jgi:hypothetical protein